VHQFRSEEVSLHCGDASCNNAVTSDGGNSPPGVSVDFDLGRNSGTSILEKRVSVDHVLEWAGEAGFTGTVNRLERQWVSSPPDELAAIALRSWPAMRELDEVAIKEVTRPTIDALQDLPQTDARRRAVAEMVAFTRLEVALRHALMRC
jgi:hypothetical protein